MNSIKFYCESVKRKIQIVIISLNLISFIIISFYINDKNTNYLEYTDLPKFCTNTYIIILLLLVLIHSIYPNFICKIISENLNILTSSKGKIIIILSIGIQFWTSNNNLHVIFAIINFISSFILILCEFIFDCKILNQITQSVNIQINNEQTITNENDISKNNNIHRHLVMNKNIPNNQSHEKNGSNVPFFENYQSKDNNYFENIKKANLKAENSNRIS